ncbi:MAG: DinB family protein [Bacteroidota bacterium]
MNRPQIQEYPEAFSNYINLVEGDVMEILTNQISDFANFLNNLVEKADYAYAPGKWTIKELVGHMIDTERIMIYRLTCFARNEKAPLPGFDEDHYVANANFSARSLFNLSEEFAQLRKSNLFLFDSLSEEELNRVGNASGKSISVRAMVYMLAGHVIHHTKIIKERYL